MNAAVRISTPQRRRRDPEAGLTWPLAMLICGIVGLLTGTWGGHMIGVAQGRSAVIAEMNGECSK